MRRHNTTRNFGIILLLSGAAAFAQGPPPQQRGNGPGGPPPPGVEDRGPGPAARRGMGMGMDMGPGMPGPGRPPMERAMGRWWNNPQMAEKIGINSDQKKKMDDNFQAYRLRLIDLNANLQKAEMTLEPLVNADQPDEAKIVAGIDRVAQARAELEKANARMLLGIRQVLTPEQWKKLQEERPAQPPPGAGNAPRPARGPNGPPRK